MSGRLKASPAATASTSTVAVGMGDSMDLGSCHSRMESLRTVVDTGALGSPSTGEDRQSPERLTEAGSRLLAEQEAVERSGTNVVFGRVRRENGDEEVPSGNEDDTLKPRMSQAKRQWSIQAVKGKVTTSCLWNACKALTIGTLLILIGAAMATIGYYAEEANFRRLQNLTEAYEAALAAEASSTTTTQTTKVTTNKSPYWYPPQIVPVNGPRQKLTKPKATSSTFGLNKLSYVGPMVMGIGGFVIVAACVMTFEARDSAAKIVPARFRKPFPERPIKPEDSGVRHCGAQTKWETLGVSGSELSKYHQEKELSRRAMTSAFIKFSKTIQSSMDSTGEYYELRGGTRSNLIKCPSAPSLVSEFHQEEKPPIEAPRILRVSAFPRPPSRRRLSSNAYPRQAMSMDNPAVREVYSTYPVFIGERGDEEMELGASATAVHRVDSDSSLALDLHLPQCSVTLSVRDSSRSPSGQTDHEDMPPGSPLLDQVIVIPAEEIAGPSGLNSLHVIPIQPKVDKQTSTGDHNHMAMMGWSRDSWDSRADMSHSSRSKGSGSFRDSKKQKSSRKVKRSETIDTASSAHSRKSHKSHHSRSRAGSIMSTHEGRRLGPSRSETARKHQLLRQTKVEGAENNEDPDKNVVV